MNGPDDFEDYVARRKPVFRGDDDPLEPPPELDRIVLRQAREAIKADRAEPAYRGAGWGMPVAMAATLLVVFSVLVYSIKVGAAAWNKKERTDNESPFQPIPDA